MHQIRHGGQDTRILGPETHNVGGEPHISAPMPPGMAEDAWPQRAERVVGALEPYASTTLCASEIGQFAFCPQAWFLGRCNIPVNAEARLRLEAGSRAHRSIGRRTDLLRVSQAAQVLLLAVILSLLVVAGLLAIRGGV